MKLYVWREYQGNWQLVGAISGFGPGMSFSYDEGYLEQSDANPLSLSLPLRDEPYDEGELRCFFEALVPESQIYSFLAGRRTPTKYDYIFILEKLNLECVGALAFSDSQDVDFSSRRSYELVTGGLLDELSKDPSMKSLDLLEASRLSLAGAQLKVGLYRDESGRLYVPHGSAPSTHIAKIAPDRFPSLPENEMICMLLADACGLEASIPDIVCIENGFSLFLSERFDRVFSDAPSFLDGLPVPERMHQEDFSQACAIPLWAKYEPTDAHYYNMMASVLARHSFNGYGERMALLRQAYFDYLVGNCDNHIKNFSLLYNREWTSLELSPAYDQVSTVVYEGLSREMGIALGGVRCIDNVAEDNLLVVAKDIGISQKSAKSIFAEVAEGVDSGMARAIEKTAATGIPGAECMGEKILASVQNRLLTLK